MAIKLADQSTMLVISKPNKAATSLSVRILNRGTGLASMRRRVPSSRSPQMASWANRSASTTAASAGTKTAASVQPRCPR